MYERAAVRVWHEGKGFLWDIPILQAVHATASPWLDRLAIALTPLGVFWGVFPASVAIGVVLLYRRNWRSLLYLVVTLLGSVAINHGTKLIFHRERPNLWEVFTHELDYAFPSGHAMSSMTFAVVLLVLLWGKPGSWLAASAGGLFVVTIGWTRLYLGVHYPSDVLGGWLLALGWTMVMAWLIRPVERSSGDRNSMPEIAATVEPD
jgi:undecaprenyl-diphosphatase